MPPITTMPTSWSELPTKKKRSAYGTDRRGQELFPGADRLHVGRTDHFGLLNHPDVLSALRTWLT